MKYDRSYPSNPSYPTLVRKVVVKTNQNRVDKTKQKNKIKYSQCLAQVNGRQGEKKGPVGETAVTQVTAFITFPLGKKPTEKAHRKRALLFFLFFLFHSSLACFLSFFQSPLF